MFLRRSPERPCLVSYSRLSCSPLGSRLTAWALKLQVDDLTKFGCSLQGLYPTLSPAGCASACGLANLVVPTVSLTRDGVLAPPGLADLGFSEPRCECLDVGGYGTCIVSLQLEPRLAFSLLLDPSVYLT